MNFLIFRRIERKSLIISGCNYGYRDWVVVLFANICLLFFIFYAQHQLFNINFCDFVDSDYIFASKSNNPFL